MALLPDYPVLYKHPNGRIEKVYHTIRARELVAAGCVCIDSEKASKSKPKVKREKTEEKVEEKTEVKTEEVKREKEPPKRRRARSKTGEFLGDDPSTPDVNEAWEIVESEDLKND